MDVHSSGVVGDEGADELNDWLGIRDERYSCRRGADALHAARRGIGEARGQELRKVYDFLSERAIGCLLAMSIGVYSVRVFPNNT